MIAASRMVDEVEADRLRRVAELEADDGPDWDAAYRPGSLGRHELLDRSALLAGMVERSILEHPACALRAEWYALAERAVGRAQRPVPSRRRRTRRGRIVTIRPRPATGSVGGDYFTTSNASNRFPLRSNALNSILFPWITT